MALFRRLLKLSRKIEIFVTSFWGILTTVVTPSPLQFLKKTEIRLTLVLILIVSEPKFLNSPNGEHFFKSFLQ